jgi:adenylosuccinate lyase
VLSLQVNAEFTSASQWFERTLDDSAGKRIALPEVFLATDAILQLYYEVASRIHVNRDAIDAHVRRELPDIASENLMMAAVKAGGDRQELHEVIRRHKMESKGGDLLERLVNDRAFAAVRGRAARLTSPAQYTGRSASQVREFLAEEVRPRLATRRRLLGMTSEVKV